MPASLKSSTGRMERRPVVRLARGAPRDTVIYSVGDVSHLPAALRTDY